MGTVEKWFLRTGLVLILVGLLLVAIRRLGWTGRVPGDVTWNLGSRRILLPVGTTALVGLVLIIYDNLAQPRR